MNKIVIDGSVGEGGGQIFRTSLTLSLLTQQSLHIFNIRSKRSSPGLKAQHLAALKASASISGAKVEGDFLGSQEVLFFPGEIRPGKYKFEIPTAGSTALVLQTIFIPLSVASKKSQVSIIGGTHVPWSPPFHYLKWQWLPWMEKIGYSGKVELDHCGYYPAGGGGISCSVIPAGSIQPVQITDKGRLIQIRGISAATDLPKDIPNRQRLRFISSMGSSYPLNDIRSVILPGKGRGTFLTVLVEFEKSTACFTSLGKKGKRAEHVADDLISEVKEYLNSSGSVDAYLPDQLLIPLSFASGPSKIKTPRVSLHLLTNAEVIQRFLQVSIRIEGHLDNPGIINIIP
ncbi:MAG: RNA 3'-terminal phosphate cyclase [Anaerolineales bacterium]|nr:RNA 3'-terminal phosphate cyclase [Anaerolineales bacterium]